MGAKPIYWEGITKAEAGRAGLCKIVKNFECQVGEVYLKDFWAVECYPLPGFKECVPGVVGKTDA